MAGQREFQQGSHSHRKTWINLLFGILQILLPCIRLGGAQLQALTQMSSVVEVWQAEDADFLVPTQAEEECSKESLPQEESSSFYARESGRPLRFQPPLLEFGTQPLGLPRAETISIHNPSQDLPVTLQSIFTSSRHFHMPAFHRRVIPPRGKTSFKLIFLPTEESNVENSLFINTSTHGVLSYQVFGVGIHGSSPGDALRKDSLLIFPHIHSIKLTQTQEDASNITILGLLLDCSLPKTFYSHPQGSCFWSEEEEGRVSLQISLAERGERPAHLDKLKPYVLENILLLLALPPTASAAYPKITIHMLNSGVKQLFVKDIQVLSRVDSILDFSQVLLRPSATNFTQVSTLSCRRSLSSQSRKCSNQISLQILGSHSVNAFPGLQSSHRWQPFELASLVQLRHTHRGADLVDLWLSNPFPTRLTITNINLTQPTPSLFKVGNFSEVGVAPGCWRLLSLQLLNRTLPFNLITVVTLATNMGFTLEMPLHLRSTGSKHGGVFFDVGGKCERLCPLKFSKAGRTEWQRSLLPESYSSLWSVDSSLASALCSRWHCSKELTCRWPRLPEDGSSSLDFGATPVNESKVKNFTLKNPTDSVVSIEIRMLSSYPAPLEALDLLTKWLNISPLSVNITTTEFSLLAADHKEGQRERPRTGDRVLRFMLQPWESRTVSVVYTPTEHKPVTSLLLIRNNLTVFDMVTVRGFGAKELLRVGGKLPGPGASLRFNVPQSTLMECRDGIRTSKPLFAIQKSFKVENAGELPLTVMSMNINGYKCQGFGFEVLQCRSFSVDHNSSSEITIAFTPDFTSSWVIRDLTLVTARGSSFPFTLNVTLPHHMLPLCAQVVPGPSWEESFWMVTLVFTCFSLVGVCLMAFHQAQYILSEFSSSAPRSNHNSSAPRENGNVSNASSNSASRVKGSCKTYTDTGHTSDKGKGRGSPAVANGAARTQTSSKKGSGGSSQPQRKHKVSLLYSKYKITPAAAAAAITPAATASITSIPPIDPPTEQEREERAYEPAPDICNNNNNIADEVTDLFQEKEHFKEVREEKEEPDVMFPMETTPEYPTDDITCSLPRPVNGVVEKEGSKKRNAEKRDDTESEVGSCSTQRKRPERSEPTANVGNSKAKKNSGKSRRKAAEALSGVAEQSVVILTEKEPENREPRNALRTRSHGPSTKPDTPKTEPNPVVCLGRPRRKVPERRPQWESGSDSGSSSGSVRASRGSWGSWSSASSMEGEKDPSNTSRHPSSASTRKRDTVQYNAYPGDRECYQTMNCTYKAQSMNSLYVKEPCQSPLPSPVASFSPSFAAVAAGMERSPDMTNSHVREETWSAPSVPLTNEFRYNMTETLPFIPQSPSAGPYNGNFPWNNMNSHCNSSYPYCEQSNFISSGNANFQSNFVCQEPQAPVPRPQPQQQQQQASWCEEALQETPSSWPVASCVGSKPYFPGTRSLSPMSSLFGSIWTPQSEPYQRHFQPERPAASTSLPHSPHSPYGREPGNAPCPPKTAYSNFNPFGPHMNLDIWNSSSNRSSTSQLSNDSGYCGDV